LLVVLHGSYRSRLGLLDRKVLSLKRSNSVLDGVRALGDVAAARLVAIQGLIAVASMALPKDKDRSRIWVVCGL